MTKQKTSCPACSHVFIPAPIDTKATLKTLVAQFSEQANGRPRTSQELHAEFLAWVIADGDVPPTFTAPQKWLTNQLLRTHSWDWRHSNDGRRYFPPGNRGYPEFDTMQLLHVLLGQFQEMPQYRRPDSLGVLFGDFFVYCQGRVPTGTKIPDRWMGDALVSDYGWMRTRMGRQRLLSPPGHRLTAARSEWSSETSAAYVPSQAVVDALASFSAIAGAQGELSASLLESEFQRYLQVHGIAASPVRWVGRELMRSHGWSRVRTNGGRFYVPPPA